MQPDFFFWGLAKNLVYGEKPTSIAHLKQKIVDSFATVDIELCQKVCRTVSNRLEMCIAAEGEHFEHLKQLLLHLLFVLYTIYIMYTFFCFFNDRALLKNHRV